MLQAGVPAEGEGDMKTYETRYRERHGSACNTLCLGFRIVSGSLAVSISSFLRVFVCFVSSRVCSIDNLCCFAVYDKVMTGESVEDMNPPKLYETGRPQGYVGCKAPMFSFTRLRCGEKTNCKHIVVMIWPCCC